MALFSRLPVIAASLEKQIDQVLQTGAERIVSDAQARVPVDSGRLRDAIHTEPADDDNGHLVIAGNDDVFYGHLVEHGGAHTPPRPFLVPAGEAARQQIVADVSNALRGL